MSSTGERSSSVEVEVVEEGVLGGEGREQK